MSTITGSILRKTGSSAGATSVLYGNYDAGITENGLEGSWKGPSGGFGKFTIAVSNQSDTEPPRKTETP